MTGGRHDEIEFGWPGTRGHGMLGSWVNSRQSRLHRPSPSSSTSRRDSKWPRASTRTSRASGRRPTKFCIDFANIDWNSNEGALVARVSMSPMLAEQLLTALSSQIDAFAQNAIEQEVGDGSSNKPETDEGDGNEGE